MVGVVSWLAISLSVLEDASKDVENEVSSHVGIEEGIDLVIIQLTIFKKLYQSEGVGIVACDKTNAVNCHEGAKKGCGMDQNVLEETESKDSEDEGSTDGEAPEACITIHLVKECII